LRDPSIKTVVLVHNPLCSYHAVKDMANPAVKDVNQVLENGMRRTFSALVKARKNVIVLFDNPPLPFDPSMCVRRRFRTSTTCSFDRSDFDSRPAWSNYKSLVNQVLKDYPEIHTYDLSGPLCDEQNCYLARNGVLLYQDTQHLNSNGSRFVAPYVIGVINSFGN
jgi:hypothetical protein